MNIVHQNFSFKSRLAHLGLLLEDLEQNDVELQIDVVLMKLIVKRLNSV